MTHLGSNISLEVFLPSDINAHDSILQPRSLNFELSSGDCTDHDVAHSDGLLESDGGGSGDVGRLEGEGGRCGGGGEERSLGVLEDASDVGGEDASSVVG